MRKLTRLLAVTVVVLVALPAAAQYPAKPIRLLMPFPAGATADIVARIVAQPLSQVLGQPVLVDNKPGADGAIAAELTARSVPDGYTLFSAGNTPMLGVPTLRKNPPYDPVADFAPITSMVKYAFFLVDGARSVQRGGIGDPRSAQRARAHDVRHRGHHGSSRQGG